MNTHEFNELAGLLIKYSTDLLNKMNLCADNGDYEHALELCNKIDSVTKVLKSMENEY